MKKLYFSQKFVAFYYRVTRVCDLDSCGHTLQDIMMITGQKCERTVKRYLTRRRDRSLFRSSMAVEAALGREVVSASGTFSSRPYHSTSSSVSSSGPGGSMCIEAGESKKMRLSIDGNKNTIDILFE
jgi:hypothetical protein